MIVFTGDDFLCKGIEKNGSYDALSVKKDEQYGQNKIHDLQFVSYTASIILT